MTRIHLRSALLVGCASALIVGAVAPGASAAALDPAESGDAAVVTPTLRMFDFGATVGLPLMCALGGSILLAGGGQFGAAEAMSPFSTQLNDGCAAISTEGHNQLTAGIESSSQFSAINPVVNPGIDALAEGSRKAGEDYGPSIAPFGPTVAEFGRTLSFFKGS
ncbi:hypothetical protein [Sporichthya sp.]|uniref:hypothetical protein n=1 Tax=Sporichthya sp. TaxID=65475 RepID=UPI0017C2EB07|nr:hypothetical protein [Sporichthya sp.]MBA3741413.1 hypothetical protein [Sporichthya sp.]